MLHLNLLAITYCLPLLLLGSAAAEVNVDREQIVIGKGPAVGEVYAVGTDKPEYEAAGFHSSLITADDRVENPQIIAVGGDETAEDGDGDEMSEDEKEDEDEDGAAEKGGKGGSRPSGSRPSWSRPSGGSKPSWSR